MRRLLDAQVDCELERGARAQFVEHASRCPECRRGIALTVKLKASLGRLAAQRPPPLSARRLQHLAEELLRG
jgi:anti-sigma factor RsiW